MNPLITISTQIIGTEETNAVNARELHAALESKRHFTDWIKAQIESLGLEENLDYEVYHENVKNLNGGRPSQEYLLTLDAAKHIAMASRVPKGKEVRRYFIEVERRYRATTDLPATRHDLPALYERLLASQETIITLQQQLLAAEAAPLAVSAAPSERRALWSPDEDQALLALRQRGLTYAQIGRQIGRTTAGVRCRAKRLRRRRTSKPGVRPSDGTEVPAPVSAGLLSGLFGKGGMR